MTPLAPHHRKQLERIVADARDMAEQGARAAIEALAVHQQQPYAHMDEPQLRLRCRLRAHARQLGDRRDRTGTQSIEHLVQECAFEQWHGMLFARFLAENKLLIDINDGVRLNIRPFMARDIPGGMRGAGILRTKPNIHRKKDTGREPLRDSAPFPWSWQADGFTGARAKDVHLALDEKQRARTDLKGCRGDLYP